MEFDHRTRFTPTRSATGADSTLAPGKRTLTEQLPVQHQEATAEPGPAAAASGTSTSAPSAIPPPAPLQALFGVRPAPTDAYQHTAAHEAAHGPNQEPGPGGETTAPPGTLLDRLTTGGGEPLEGAVCRTLETAFNADFSAVRIHRSEVPSELRAQALVRGSHLYFAPGSDALHGSSRLALLGHELAHVVQQAEGRVVPSAGLVTDPSLEAEADRWGAQAARGEVVRTGARLTISSAPGSAVQAALGFEFQTYYPLLSEYGTALDYGTRVFTHLRDRPAEDDGEKEKEKEDPGTHAYFHIESDNRPQKFITDQGIDKSRPKSVMEFITPPLHSQKEIEETLRRMEIFEVAVATATGRGSKTATLQEVCAEYHLKLLQANVAPERMEIPRPHVQIGHSDECDATGQLYERNMSARPQATMGVPLEQVFPVLSEFRDRLAKEAEKQPGPTIGRPRDVLTEALERAGEAVQDPQWAKLKGLLTLVVLYGRIGPNYEEFGVLQYAKTGTPFMLRTDFHALYGLLDKKEKRQFRNRAWLIDAIGRQDTEFIYAQGFQFTTSQGKNKMDTGPTIGDWLTSIASPDKFVLDKYDIQHCKESFYEALGAARKEHGGATFDDLPEAAREACKNAFRARWVELQAKDLMSRGAVGMSASAMGALGPRHAKQEGAIIEWRGMDDRTFAQQRDSALGVAEWLESTGINPYVKEADPAKHAGLAREAVPEQAEEELRQLLLELALEEAASTEDSSSGEEDEAFDSDGAKRPDGSDSGEASSDGSDSEETSSDGSNSEDRPPPRLPLPLLFRQPPVPMISRPTSHNGGIRRYRPGWAAFSGGPGRMVPPSPGFGVPPHSPEHGGGFDTYHPGGGVGASHRRPLMWGPGPVPDDLADLARAHASSAGHHEVNARDGDASHDGSGNYRPASPYRSDLDPGSPPSLSEEEEEEEENDARGSRDDADDWDDYVFSEAPISGSKRDHDDMNPSAEPEKNTRHTRPRNDEGPDAGGGASGGVTS